MLYFSLYLAERDGVSKAKSKGEGQDGGVGGGRHECQPVVKDKQQEEKRRRLKLREKH